MVRPKPVYDYLFDYATPKQQEYLKAVQEHGSALQAAKAIGVYQSSISRAYDVVAAKAAKAGHAEGHFTSGVAPGFRMGKVTIQRGPSGVERVWERQSPESQDIEAMIREAVEACQDSLRGLAPITPSPGAVLKNLLSVYAMGDPHFGMYAWGEETGDDFDLDTASALTRGAVDRLVPSSPASKTAILLQAGDFFHADDSKNQTPGRGHALDVDTRYAKVMKVGIRAMIYAIQRLLEKHRTVIVWNLPGNHDPHSSFALALALEAFFHAEPRVTIDTSPSLYRYHLHGKVLIGAHHGHGAKQADLPLLMAVDRSAEWGASTIRYVYIGHIHHDTVKEVQGVRVESLRTLAGKDAWHAGKGYRALRDMRVIVHHAEFGEIERHTCNVAMIQTKSPAVVSNKLGLHVA